MRSYPIPVSFPLFQQVTAQIKTGQSGGLGRSKIPRQADYPTWEAFNAPLREVLREVTPLESKSNRPIDFTFSDQIHSLVYLHVEQHASARGLIEDLNDPAHPPLEGLPDGVARSTFFDALHSRGWPQMQEVFDRLGHKAARILGPSYKELGDLRAIDGSLIEATLSMEWADYTATTHKAKVHLCLDLNRGIPRKLLLTAGKAAERPVAAQQLEKGQTGVLDRGYQDHRQFDTWQEAGKAFVCRIRKNTQKTLLQSLPIPLQTNILFYAEVFLGDLQHRSRYPVRLVGLKVGRKTFWIATNRTDLTALQIAFIYRLRWEIERFFAWWKRYLNVYPLIAHSPYGLMMQLLSGLITYLLLVIYFHRRFDEPPSLSRLRQFRRDIRKERALRQIGLRSITITVVFFPTARSGFWLCQIEISAIS